MRVCKKCVSVMLVILTVLTVMTVGVVPGAVKANAASWNGYNYRGGQLYGYRTFLQAFGIDYDVYLKWMDDHDKDSPNPNYYLGTPYAHNDHRNPRGDCSGAYGDYDTPGVAAMNCTGFVWHVLYKAAVHSGASSEQISRLKVMWRVPVAWSDYGVYRIWFDSIEDAYNSGVLEKGDLMWIYGSSDNHNAIFYGDSPKDFIYWDSAGERNRYAEVHSIGSCRGLWVAKVTQPNNIELQIDTASGGKGTKFGTKYMVFNSKAKAQAALNNPNNEDAWDEREGTIVLDSNGHGCFRKQSAPSYSELWSGNTPRTNHSYFSSDAKRVDCEYTYYAVQWSHSPGVSEDDTIHVFTDSGKRTPSGYRIYRFYAPIHVDTPDFSNISSNSDGVLLKWNSVKDAYRYRVYYKNRNNDWIRMAETASTSYLDKDVKDGSTYTYTIRCVDQYGNFISDFNTSGHKHTYHLLDTPEITKLESTPEGVQITWNAVNNTIDDSSTRYRVYYKSQSGDWKRMTETTDTVYTDTDVDKGGTYTYTVRCVDANGNFVSKFNSTGWKHTYLGVNTPQFTETVSEPEGIRLKWNSISNVYRYRIYRKTGDSWTRIAQTADTEYLDKDITAGESYTYTIRCVNSAGNFVSDFNKDGWNVKYKGIATPNVTGLTAEPDGVRVIWSPVENAVNYRVYRKTPGGSWARIAELSDSEYFDGDITENTDYLYTVRCVNNAGGFMSDCNYNGWKVHYQGVATPQITNLSAEIDGVRVTLSPVENAVRYRIYRKTPGESWTRIAEIADTEYFDGDITQQSSYLYTVRCVNNVGGFMSDCNYDGWSVGYQGVDTPQITGIGSEPDGIRLTWSPVENAINYRVYRKISGGSWTRIAEQSENEYLDEDCELNTDYLYTVRCVNNVGGFMSDYNKNGWKARYTGVALPEFSKISSEAEGVRLKWKAVDGATSYRVYMRVSDGWDRLIETKDTEFFDDSIPLESTRVYTIRCINKSGGFASEFNESGWKVNYNGISIPAFTKITNEPEGIRLKWNAVNGAATYRVYARGSNGWDRLTETKNTEFFDDTIPYGETRLYTIRCINSKGDFASLFNETGWKATYTGVDTPQITVLESTKEGVNIKWEPVEGAVKYRVFYKGANGWERLATVDGTEFLDTDVRAGKTYIYTVRCLGSKDNYISDYNHSGSKVTFQPPEDPAPEEPSQEPVEYEIPVQSVEIG